MLYYDIVCLNYKVYLILCFSRPTMADTQLGELFGSCKLLEDIYKGEVISPNIALRQGGPKVPPYPGRTQSTVITKRVKH